MNIFLSPHHDDVCFSLAITTMALGGGHIINIFSQSDNVAGPTRELMGEERNQSSVSALRAQEDVQFCKIVNLVRHDLGLLDSPLRGDDPFDASNVDDQAIVVESALEPLLRKLIADSEIGAESVNLFCPMGIGGHRDHLATLKAVTRLQAKLPFGFKFRFYEDLFYASDYSTRQKGLERFAAMNANKQFYKIPLRLTPADLDKKMQMTNLYKSQHESMQPASVFIPADICLHGPHEAIWESFPT